MRLVIIGGHLSPALSVIESLPKDAKILFVGRKHAFEGDKAISLEYETIHTLGVPFAEISTGRIQRIFTRHTIPSLLKIPYGFIQSFFILKKFKPDVVLSLGGYLSIPVVCSAFMLRIPIVIHEQTLEQGLSNRWMKYFAKKICISWETSRKYFPKEKTVMTGNPIRKFEVRSSKFEVGIDKTLPAIYITGGSAGSHFINTLIEGCIRQLLEKFIIIHQTGDAQEYHDFDRLQKFRESLSSELKIRYIIKKFVEPENVGSILQKADLVIARSGINTVTELVFFKKPSLLIPIPVSEKNEQVKNAMFLKSLGFGEVYSQDILDSSKLLKIILGMFDNIDRYKSKHKLETEIHANAAQKIIEVIEYVAKQKKDS